MNEVPDGSDPVALANWLFDLARDGDAARLAAYVDAGAPVDLTDAEGNTLLMLAAYHDQADAVRLTDPPHYAQLAEAVEAWGFRLTQEIGDFLSRPEVARRWFGEEFLPVVRMARRAGIRADIDSDAELYLWLAGERYRLFRRHIWDDAVFEQLSDAARRYRR